MLGDGDFPFPSTYMCLCTNFLGKLSQNFKDGVLFDRDRNLVSVCLGRRFERVLGKIGHAGTLYRGAKSEGRFAVFSFRLKAADQYKAVHCPLDSSYGHSAALQCKQAVFGRKRSCMDVAWLVEEAVIMVIGKLLQILTIILHHSDSDADVVDAAFRIRIRIHGAVDERQVQRFFLAAVAILGICGDRQRQAVASEGCGAA